MTTPKDIRIQAQTLCGQTIDSAVSLIWVTDAITSIAYRHFMSCPYEVEEIETTTDNEIAVLSKEIVKFDKLIDSNNRRSVRFDLKGDKLTIYDSGKYEARYYATIPVPATETSEITMPTPYLEAIKYFVASRIRARYMGQNDTNAVSFMQEYTNALKEADSSMARRNSRGKTMPPGRRTL